MGLFGASGVKHGLDVLERLHLKRGVLADEGCGRVGSTYGLLLDTALDDFHRRRNKGDLAAAVDHLRMEGEIRSSQGPKERILTPLILTA